MVNTTRVTSFICCALIALLALPAPLHAQAVATPDVWRSFAERLDVGTTLKVRLTTGERFKATLLQVSPDAMMLQPKTRAAVPPQRVPYDRIETLEIDRGKGIGVGKAVAIGVGSAAGAFLTLMVMAFAIWGD